MEKKKTRAEVLNDYDGFVEKFKPKKTTDDCYTPSPVYEAVVKFVDREIMPLDSVEVIRPFWPGADYQALEYPEGCVVIDNPPFSILSRIRRFYQQHGIRYFLFAPSLTCLSATVSGFDTVIVCNASITYENGAVVSTAFVTNMLPSLSVWVNGDLGKQLTEASKGPDKSNPRYVYDPHVITTATLQKYARPGIDWKIRREDCSYVRKLDCQNGRSIFGNGYLISERAAAERAAAERAAAERAATERAATERAAARETHYWPLSPREWKIVQNLGRK